MRNNFYLLMQHAKELNHFEVSEEEQAAYYLSAVIFGLSFFTDIEAILSEKRDNKGTVSD